MMNGSNDLAGSYTIPKLIALELQREDEFNEKKSDHEVKERVKSSYNQQSTKLAEIVYNPTLSYRQRMARDDDNKETSPVIIQSDTPIRRKRKRWDVTPEERDQLIAKELLELEKVNEKKTVIEENYVPPSLEIDQATKDELMINIPEINGLEYYRKEDKKYFGKLEIMKNQQLLSIQEKEEYKIMELLLRIKNGNSSTRKKSLRLLTDSITSLKPELLFDNLLPLLVEPSLEDQERHVLVKLSARIVFKLDTKIRPFTQKILAAIGPLLIDEELSLRLEAREIISSLAKTAGLANMLSTLRPDLESPDEYIRNITSRILAVVITSLGLSQLMPFLKAVIRSKKNWQIRHTGIKTIQQYCIQLGSGNGISILPFLDPLIELLKSAISDEQVQIRSITANTLSQIAETVNPYGMDYFEPILEPLWIGIKRHRGRPLAMFLKSLGSIIPLMVTKPDYEEYRNYYTKELVNIISREFGSPDDEIRSTVLRVLIKLPLSKQILRNYLLELYKPLFKYFWNRRTATDNRVFYKLVVSATTELALKLDYLRMIDNLIVFTKDSNEQLRKMAVDTIYKIISAKPSEFIGTDPQFEARIVDGVLFAFQEQTQQNKVYLNGLSTVANTLGIRLKPHMDYILSTVLYQIKNKSPETREQSALLVAAIAPVIHKCTYGESDIMEKLILILYESLGEVYPEVLAAILLALNACLNCYDTGDLLSLKNPSINQLLPSLSPILKNRHERVQESCIIVIGLIARKCPETINVREWMRICFDLLETLKSTKKRIRIAANSTFGDIANTIGPQDILVMLLNNLRVQERQLRVCMAVAIGIVAEVCAPFTVIPAIMNEYRTPSNNVQNGVLKAMTFLFEYLEGNQTKDYLYAVTSMIQHALTDRDLVHRQTAATIVKHIALNCQGCISLEFVDVFIHYLNLLLPNVFETSPHVIMRILEALDGLRNVIGYGKYMNYVWAGLFHPAKKVRRSYWKLYNLAYIQHSDALVPFYPEIESGIVEEFDLFI